MLYTDALGRAFAWQWLEVTEDAKSAQGLESVEAHVSGCRSGTETSQLGTRLLLRFGLQGHRGLLEVSTG